MILSSALNTPAFTSGTTSFFEGSIRQADELSIIVIPFSANFGAHSSDVLPPAVNKQRELGIKARVLPSVLVQAAVFDIADLTDPRRDRLTMSLVRAAVAAGTPLLGVCRGLQEMNVALGGSLCQRLHAEPGFDDHREPEGVSPELQFAPRHEVHLEPGSAFAGWAGGTRARVNSLHGQGISRLGQGLVAQARAPDGLVEGVQVADAKAFAFGVQWHPEWHFAEMPFYRRMLEAFAHACRVHQHARAADGATP